MKKILLVLTVILGFSNISVAADKINVYYFYSKPSCITCTKIESYTKKAIESMKDKGVVYQSIDMQKAENATMVKKYNLFTKSVVVSKIENGKELWKNLDKIWVKASNEQDFQKYIVTEIKKIKGAK